MAKRKKVGSIDYTPFILLGVIGVGGYFFYKMIVGSNGNSQNSADLAKGVADSTAQSLSAAAASGDTQQLSSSQLQTIADVIFRDGMKTKGVAAVADQDDIVYQMSLPGSLTDVLLVIQDFGTKKIDNSGFLPTLCSEFAINCPSVDIGSFLHAVLDSDHLTQLNSNLSGNGINYQF